MRRLIALTISVSLLIASPAFAADVSSKLPVPDAVSAASTEQPATEESKPAATTTTKKPEPTTTTKPAATTTTKPAATTPGKPAPAPSKPAAKPAPAKKYQDGVYVAYSNAYSKGTEGAKVTIKDGKIAGIELLRTSPKLIDRDARFNYMELWQAYEALKGRLLGKTREQAAEADVVSGATRSSNGWKLSVDRAFERALTVKPQDQIYFEGEHMGVDPEGKYMVFASYDKSRLIGVKVYPLNEKGDAVEEAAMSAEQAKTVYTIANELLYRGLKAQPVKGYENEFKAAVNALWDAEQNAKVRSESKYIDGFYSAYGVARDKGVERADVYIRNDKLVDVKLYRLGSNLLDRGATAYEFVVKANEPMVKKLLANGSYIANYDDKLDAITGATESSHSWNLAVQRAFEKALRTPASKAKFFEGVFAGVDNLSRVLVLADVQADHVKSVQVILMDDKQKVIAEDKLKPEQKDLTAKLGAGLLKEGVKMADPLGQEALSAAAKTAYEDALKNAYKKQGNYRDGTFTAYGDAYDKGTHRADVTLRNGKIVGLSLYRVGVNMVDRGASAYAEVVMAIPVLTKNILAAATRENAQKVDAVTGATSSSTELKNAVDRAFKKAEIVEPYKAAYMNGLYAGVDADKSAYVMVTVEKNVPVKMQVFYLDENGKLKAEDTLSADELAVKAEMETPATETMHKYAYRPAAFGEIDAVKALSGKVIDAVKNALENAGR